MWRVSHSTNTGKYPIRNSHKVINFVCCSFGQFYIDELKQLEPFISTLNIASCLLDACSKDRAQELAKKLGELQSTCTMYNYDVHSWNYTIFSTCRLYSANLWSEDEVLLHATVYIHLNTYTPIVSILFCCPCRYRILCECIQYFLVGFCFHLEQNRASAGYIRDVLQVAMPQINCN